MSIELKYVSLLSFDNGDYQEPNHFLVESSLLGYIGMIWLFNKSILTFEYSSEQSKLFWYLSDKYLAQSGLYQFKFKFSGKDKKSLL